ncbi:unnamed protein product [Trifolium pratense]|uniref:Uncharacterized protein n=1 Tax=Trifolium pratense TaxID=57577 RepID=A0ACB0IH86_TRIPR|nr:unnamed protein product [Trifolium pratense]
MSENKVTLESKLTVVSSRPVKSGKTHKLSGVDHAMGYHTLHLIFYYKNEEKWFGSFELDPLRESLSEVLSIYPTVTGRLAREKEEDGGDWEVRCNDAGVRVIKANVDCTIDEWLSSSAFGFDETQLIAWDDMPHDTSTWSPFRIQINSFKEGGIAIGLSCSHMLSDLTFASSFFKSWSQTHRHYPISHPPFFNPITPNNINNVPNSSSKPQTIITSSTNNIVTATFKFPSSIIKQCLSKIQNTTCSNATPFDFLSALFWTRVTHLKPSKVHNQNHSLSICRDFRKLVKPSLPIGYFGNALHFSNLSIKVQDMENGQLEDMANLIHKHLKEVTEEEIRSSIESFETRKESTPKCMYGSELTCVYMEEEESASLLYESMFSNSEKPAHVSCRIGNVDSEGLIMVMPSSEGGFARTVIVMLQEEELGKLCNDQEILKLEPTIILAGCLVQH